MVMKSDGEPNDPLAPIALSMARPAPWTLPPASTSIRARRPFPLTAMAVPPACVAWIVPLVAIVPRMPSTATAMPLAAEALTIAAVPRFDSVPSDPAEAMDTPDAMPSTKPLLTTTVAPAPKNELVPILIPTLSDPVV